MRILFLALMHFANVLFSYETANAQEIKPLDIGDQVPDIIFEKMLNYSGPSGQLSDFKGKAVIIDMWFKECGVCINGMPHLDSLQKEFQDDLQLMLVTWQPKADIEDFWKKNYQVKHLKFTQAVEDTITRMLFPARGYPHQIWIDKEGRVAAITDGSSTNMENVKKLIQGMPLDLKVKQDELDPNVSYSVEPMIHYYYEQNKPNILFYSYFSRYRPEFAGGSQIRVDKKNQLVRAVFRNADFLLLYHCAYTAGTVFPIHRPSRMIREDSNPIDTKEDYKEMTNVFCYDLIYRDTVDDNLGQYMITDLDRFFNVKSNEEIRDVDCYILRPTGKSDRYLKPLDQDEDSFVINEKLQNGKAFALNRGFVPNYENNLMNHVDKPFLWEFDEEIRKVSNLFKRTNLVSFKVVWNLDDLPAMNKELAEYGLEIIVEKRPQKVIILRD